MPKKKNTQPEDIKDKDKALQLAIDSLEKQFGKGVVITDKTEFSDIEYIPTGSLSLDIAMGGGYARGRMVELYGKESAGKTTVAIHAIAECQKLGGKCAFIDAEHAFDATYAESLGVDIDKLIFSQPNNGEQALNVSQILTRSGAIDLIVIDSVAALVPRAELEKNIGDSSMGLQARMMSQTCRVMTGIIRKTNTCIIFINQIREKLNVMFGSPEVVSGGNALKFYSSQRLDIRRKGIVTEGEEKVGITSKVKVVKNKVGPPFKEAEFNIIFGKGIDREADLLNLAIQKNIVKQSGAWMSYKDQQIGQGINKACIYLRENVDIAEEIKEQLVLK